MFSKFAKFVSKKLGNPNVFVAVIFLVLLWLVSGPLFNFNDTWQLIINTFSSIVTLLMVFLLQNTQNRDTTALHLKLDEIIRAMEHTHNELLKIEELEDKELQAWLERYEKLATDIRQRIEKGEDDLGRPEIIK